MTFALAIPAHGQLAKQCDRHGVRLVALISLGKKCALDLG